MVCVLSFGMVCLSALSTIFVKNVLAVWILVGGKKSVCVLVNMSSLPFFVAEVYILVLC